MTCTASPTDSVCPCGVPHFPVVICNPANQPQIVYRVGDYLAFRDRLLRPLPGETQLNQWRPQANGDLAVQLVEWWAYLADILTFYDERIANEAYLATATLPESVNHLVQLLGYRPRPALGARVTLAGLLSPSPRLPVQLPKGLQVQSKPGPGQSPQIFELDAPSSLLAPDLISTTITPADTGLGGNNLLWLAGKVTSVKPGDSLLLINQSALMSSGALADYAWIKITTSTPVTDPLGNSVIALSFRALSSSLGLTTPTNEYLLLRSVQSSPLWSLASTSAHPAISSNSAVLAGLARDLTPASLVVLDTPPGAEIEAAVRRVSGYSETFWYANGAGGDQTKPPTSPATPVGIPVSQITFDTLARVPASGEVTVRYGFKSVGDLTQVLTLEDLSYPGGGSLLAPRKADFSLPQEETTVLLEDAGGVASLAVLSASSGAAAAIAPSPPNSALALASPIDVMFNLLPFSRGKTIASETLGSGNPAVAGQDFALKNAPVTYFADPASVSGDGFSSTVEVSVNNALWREAQSFYGQAPNAQVYVLHEDDAGQTHVTFGDGVNGALLPTGVNNVVATYRYGAGAAAPSAETLTVVQTPQPGLKGVRNPLAPTGGGDADAPARLRGLAPQSVLAFNRAVSLDDYAAIALTNSSVNQAVAGYAFDPLSQRPKITLWVAGDAGVKAAASQALAGITLPGQGLDIQVAKPVQTDLTLTFLCDSNLDAPTIQTALVSALTNTDTGLFGARKIGIGEVVFESQIEAACLAVSGVKAIHNLAFETSFTFELRLGFRPPRRPRFPLRPIIKIAQGCSGRRHDPGAGAYFQIASLSLNPQIVGAS